MSNGIFHVILLFKINFNRRLSIFFLLLLLFNVSVYLCSYVHVYSFKDAHPPATLSSSHCVLSVILKYTGELVRQSLADASEAK